MSSDQETSQWTDIAAKIAQTLRYYTTRKQELIIEKCAHQEHKLQTAAEIWKKTTRPAISNTQRVIAEFSLRNGRKPRVEK